MHIQSNIFSYFLPRLIFEKIELSIEKMNLINIAKDLLYLTQMEFHFENSTTGGDEILASQQLLEILKTLKDSYFNELHTYQPLDYCDKYDEVTDEGDSAGEDEAIDGE